MSAPRELPAQTPPVETGVVPFGDDHPGLFIGGCHAFAFSGPLYRAIEAAAWSCDRPLLAALYELIRAATTAPARSLLRPIPEEWLAFTDEDRAPKRRRKGEPE